MNGRDFAYRRREIRRPYRVLIIVCEGGKTERIYFNRYKKRDCNLRILTPNTSSTDPINLVKFAKNQIRKYDLDIQENRDQVWCAFDVNNNSNTKILEAIRIANENNITIALSNPCFELWYLLHYAYHEGGLTSRDTIDILKRHLHNYQKSNDVFDVLLCGRDRAINNAQRLNRYHTSQGTNLNSRDSNPSTQVFQIVEYILSITECED